MDSGLRSLPADWTSRVISLVAFATALGGVGYLVLQDRVSRSRDELVATFKTELENLERDHQTKLDQQDKRMAAWNDQIVNSLDRFHRDAQGLLNQIAEDEKVAAGERREVFRQQIATLTGNGAEVADAQGMKTESAQDAVDTSPSVPPATESGALAQSGPRLAVKESTFYPSENGAALVTIQNPSDEEVLIRRIRFQPKRDFEIKDPLDDATVMANASGKILTVVYLPEDNVSRAAGKHGVYDRSLQNPIRIPAGESRALRLIIEDSKHTGWGFQGKLVVDYNAERPLQVNDVSVVFAKL